MKNFRNELLEDLFNRSGEFVDIKYLTDKYCGEGNTFENEDETKVRCRLDINLVLRELEGMKWINLIPKGGMSTGHSMNHSIGKRQFIMDVPVKARMTTHGEVEYRKSINFSMLNSEIKIGDGFNGVFVNNSDLSAADFRTTISPTTVQRIEVPNAGVKPSILKLIMNNVWVIATAVIGGLIVAFLAYKFGWV